MDKLTVIAIVEAKPGKEAELAQALKDLTAPSRAEAGNHVYVPNQSRENPGLFVVYEIWESDAALEDHMATPHFRSLQAQAGDLIASLTLHKMTALG